MSTRGKTLAVVLAAAITAPLAIRSHSQAPTLCDQPLTENLSDMYAHIIRLPGAAVVPSQNPHFEVILASQGQLLWNFTKATHPAHPSVACRRIVKTGDELRVETQLRCNVAKADCDRLAADYAALDKQMTEHVKQVQQDCIQDKDADLTISACSDIIRRMGSVAGAYLNRGGAYYKKGDYDRAIADTTRVIEIDPGNAFAYRNRGLAYSTRGDHDRAIADYNRAIEIDPGNAMAYSDRSTAFFRKGEYDQAIADLSRTIEINPGIASAYSDRAITYGRKGDYDRVIADYNKAIEIDPRNPDYYNGRAWAYFKIGKAAQGLPDAQRSLKLRPNDAAALDTRGHIFEALGRREEAIADFRRALAVDAKAQSSREALNRLGASP